MPDPPQPQKDGTPRTYNISVVGPPKSGKSCLCNRFALPHPDFYREDHSSVLSAADFGGEVVNFEHWLYWGCVTRRIDGCTVNFRIIEQTEFLNDCTFKPFIPKMRLADSPQDYMRRSSATRLSSERKLRYICKDQLGQENTYEMEYFPSGIVEINGFILVCDISLQHFKVASRSARVERKLVQLKANIQSFLTTLIKLRKPIVIAITKFDICCSVWFEELSTFLKKSSEFKRIPLIETSAHQNINIEQVFLTLLKLIEKQRLFKVNSLCYSEAIHLQESERESALVAFTKLLSHAPSEFLESWSCFMKRYSQQVDVVTFTSMVGTEVAQREFEKFVRCQESNNRQSTINRIISTLAIFLPSLDPIRNKSLQEVAQYIRSQEHFSLYFRDFSADCDSADRRNATEFGSSRHRDTRIPFSLLIDTDSEGLATAPLQFYLDRLTMAEHCSLEKARLEATLYANSSGYSSYRGRADSENGKVAILPGQPLSEIDHIMDMVDLTVLTDDAVTEVYKHFQCGLRVRARDDFLDLLLERTDLFVHSLTSYIHTLVYPSNRDSNFRGSCRLSFCQPNWDPFFDDSLDVCDSSTVPSITSTSGISTAHGSSNTMGNHALLFTVPPRGVKEAHLSWIDDQLCDDWRHQMMAYLPSERQTLLASHFKMLLPCVLLNNPDAHIPRGNVTNCRSVPAISPVTTPPGQEVRSSLPFTSEARFVAPQNSSVCQLLAHDCSSHYCPSLSWGGCMDNLFKRLAYTSLPISPHCLDPSLNTIDKPAKCYSSTGVIGSPNCCDLSNQTSLHQTDAWRVNQLFIAVACVCTDCTAAEAVMHLLSCAGFSMTSLLSLRQHAPTSVSSDHISDDAANAVEFSTHPFILSALWPLPISKLPPGDFSSPQLVTGRKDAHSPGIHIGQVHVTLMSLPKVISNLLSSCLLHDSVSTHQMGPFLPTTNPSVSDWCLSRRVYHGYIFVLGSQGDASLHGFSERGSDGSQCKIISTDPATMEGSTLPVPVSRTVSTGADDGDDSMLTPRPSSDSSFLFTNDARDREINNTHEHKPSIQLPSVGLCNCCALFGMDHGHSTVSTDCVCETCCSCPQSITGLVHKHPQQQHFGEVLPSDSNSTESASHSSAYRPLSWDSRLAAIRSVLDILPKEVPHMLLLADHMSHPKDISKNTAPVIYPASSTLYSSHLTSCSFFSNDATSPDLHCCPDPASSASRLRRDGTSNDSLPPPNILDHLINFLSRCWDTAGTSATESLHPPPSNPLCSCSMVSFPSTSKPASSEDSFAPPSSNSSSGPAASSIRVNNISATTTHGLSSNSSLFLTASATGRRAMQKTNRALKKLSVSTRRLNPVANPDSTSHRSQSKVFTKCTNSSKRKSATCVEIPHPNAILSSKTHTENLTLDAVQQSVVAPSSSSVVDRKAANSHWRSEWPTVHASLSMLFPSRASVEQGSGTPTASRDCAAKEESTNVIRFRNNPFRKTVPPQTSADHGRSICQPLPSPPSDTTRSRCSVPDCEALFPRTQFPRLTNTDRTFSSHTLTPSQSFRPSCPLHTPACTDSAGTCSTRPSSLLNNSDATIPCPFKRGSVLGGSSAQQLRPPPERFAVKNMATAGGIHEHAPYANFTAKPMTLSTGTDRSQPCRFNGAGMVLRHDLSSPADLTSGVAGFPLGADEVESVYEDLDFASPDGSSPTPCLIRDNHPDVFDGQDTNFCATQHIYCDPIDCLGPAFLERHRCLTTKFPPGCLYSSPVDTRPSPNQCSNHSSSGNSAVYPDIRSAATETMPQRRERQRSFSTPENYPTTAENTIRPGSSPNAPSGHPTSAFFAKEHCLAKCQPIGCGGSVRPTGISSRSSSSGVPATPVCCSPPVCHSPPLEGGRDTPISSGASVNYTGSGLISEGNLSERVLSTDAALSFSRRCSPLLQPLSCTHHHHLWHHSDCPHHRLHGIQLDFRPATSASSLAPVSSKKCVVVAKMMNQPVVWSTVAIPPFTHHDPVLSTTPTITSTAVPRHVSRRTPT
ncbi:unnamed protein product [Dicrocoelium dendriticum]|nr:unnamed protein product [Dicrocoelium dendriticum]